MNEKVSFLSGDVSNYMTVESKMTNTSNPSAKGNNETVFMVLDPDDDLDIYTGIDNVPDVYLTAATKSDSLHVAYVKEVDDTYAEYVFIDASDLTDGAGGNVKIDESSSSDDYLFISAMNPTKVIKVSGDDGYVPANALLQGVDQVVKIDKGEVGRFTYGQLYNKIKTNADGYITDADPIVDDTDTEAEYAVNFNPDHSGNAIILGSNSKQGTMDSYGYYTVEKVLASDAAIHLIVVDKDLMDDEDNDYEVQLNISGSKLESELRGYNIKYNWFAIMDDDYSDVIKELYVWVYEATPTASSSTSSATTNDQKLVDIAMANVKAEYDVTAANASAVASAVKTAVEKDVGSGVTVTAATRSFTAASAGSMVPAEVKVTITSGSVSESVMVTAFVSVPSTT